MKVCSLVCSRAKSGVRDKLFLFIEIFVLK